MKIPRSEWARELRTCPTTNRALRVAQSIEEYDKTIAEWQSIPAEQRVKIATKLASDCDWMGVGCLARQLRMAAEDAQKELDDEA